jgi:hypothetical protein
VQDASKPIWFKELKDSKKIKIMVATPVHSDVSIHYTQALLIFQGQCFLRNIQVDFLLLKSSLVTQGRNLCVSNFLNGDYTHLLFIDSDIEFNPESIFKMLELDKEVISIPYPMKTIDWDSMYKRLDQIKNSDQLSKLGLMYPIKVENQDEVTSVDGVIEVLASPTGCMLIKRETFTKMIEAYPELRIDQPTILNGQPVNRSNFWNFFDTYFDQEEHKYHGEDFAFCLKWRKIGGKCYCYIMDEITHVGEHCYTGRFWDELYNTTKIDDSDKIK